MKFEIDLPDQNIERRVKQNWDRVAKPLDGLGAFEGIIARIGAILGTEDIDITKKAVIVMCADNGIVAEGVSQSGQEVTAAVTENLGKNNTSVCKMAKAAGADIIPVDIGVNTDKIFPGVTNKKIRKGTNDFFIEPAMSGQEALQAIQTGMELVKEGKDAGYTLLGTGEMGIGNTTTSAAMAAALLDVSPETVSGRGAGLSDAGLVKKRQVIAEALKKYQLKSTEPMQILCSVGGLDIAGLCGVFLGGAKYHIPIVIDGVISAVAALTAERLSPGTREYMIPSHRGKEPASELLMKELGLHPVIDAGLALGEGTGAVMMFSLLDMAMTLYETGATFGDFHIEEYHRF